MSNYGFDERDATTATTREAMQQQQQATMPPPQQGYGYGYGQPPVGWQPYRRPLLDRIGSTETKPFYLTSEFLVSVLVSLVVALSAATMHAFGGWRACILIAAITCSYNLSRGIAKAGTSSRAQDPRDEMRLPMGRDHEHDGR
jgi:hypothetical protein